MLKCYTRKFKEDTELWADYLVTDFDTDLIYGIGNARIADDPKTGTYIWKRTKFEFDKESNATYIPCETQDVLKHENFWLLPPTVIALLKTQKHA